MNLENVPLPGFQRHCRMVLRAMKVYLKALIPFNPLPGNPIPPNSKANNPKGARRCMHIMAKLR